MDLWTALFTVFRRWYVSLPIAVLGVIATIMIGGRIEQQYEAKASVVLVPAPYKVVNSISQPPENPYDPRGAAAAVFRRVSSPDLQREFEADGDSKDFTVTLDQNAAIIDFTVTGDGEEQTLQTAERLVQETKTNLARIQAAALVEEDAAISLNLINISTEAEPVKGNKPRVMATIFVLGMVAAISAAFIVESFGARRRQRDAGGMLPMNPMQPVPAFAYPAVAGQPGAYMPVVPVPAVVAPGEVVQAAPVPTAAPTPAAAPSAPADLYGSVDDLIDDLDSPADDLEPSADERPRTSTKDLPGRNGAGNGSTEAPKRKSIDGGRRGGKSDRSNGAATGNGSNGRPTAPTGDGGGAPTGADASSDRTIDLTAAPIELDRTERSSRLAPRRTQVAGSSSVGTVEPTAPETTSSGTTSDITSETTAGGAAAPTAATTAADADALVVEATQDIDGASAALADRADAATDVAAQGRDDDRMADLAKDLGAKRSGAGAPGRSAAARTTAKPARRPVETVDPDPKPVESRPSPSNARMRDGAKGRRASLFSASGERTKDERPTAD